MRRHLFVCTNSRVGGKPACGKAGEALIAIVQRVLIERRVTNALVTPSGCFGMCFDGPNAAMYPDNTWYSHLTPEDGPGLADHLEHGTVLEAKLGEQPGGDDQ